MWKRSVVCCCLLLLMMTFGSVVSANAPYASILAFTQNIAPGGTGAPIMNILATLNIINLTPWEIYIGSPQNNNDILHGFTGPAVQTSTQTSLNTPSQVQDPMALQSFWLKGINRSGNPSGAFGNSFAFHSLQIGLNNPNNAWLQPNINNNIMYNASATDLTSQAQAGSNYFNSYAAYTAYVPIPIVFNTNSGAQGSNTAALNFMVTSSLGFAVVSSKPGGSDSYKYQPAYALSFGDGKGNNYSWYTQATGVSYQQAPASNSTLNVSQFLTIQAQGNNAGNWYPVTTATGGSNTPAYLNTAALAYPNFSTYSGITAVSGVEYDLVVMLQSGDYAQISLLFLASPRTASSVVRK